MSLHLLLIRCVDCGETNPMRKPNRTVLIPKIVARFQCPVCHPESLNEVCGGCHLPFSVVKFHSKGLCNTCVVRNWRLKRYNQAFPDTVAS
jgi:hypothetical protein